MVLFNQTIIGCLLLAVCWALLPKRLTKKTYEQRMLSQFNNTHFFIVTSKQAEMAQITRYLQEFQNEHKIELYQCSPTENKQICPLDTPILLIINTIKILFNGHAQHQQDYYKWIKFRLTEYPHRLHSIQELKFHLQDKNEVFCFVDRQGQQITKKQYIFIATAKKFHFLYYCSLDVSIGRQIGLREGHLALIRRDLSYNFDYWSERVLENNAELHQIWSNFLMSSCQSQFRLENKGKSHDIVTVECDFSLECQQEMLDILSAELKWRVKHPQINFKLKFLPGTKGEIVGRQHNNDLPVMKFAKTVVKKRIVHQESGAVLEETDYIRDVYMKTNPVINEETIENILQEYEAKTLQYVIQETQTDIRSLDGQQGEHHREIKRRKEQAEQL